jgi:hypothetical protein
METKNIMFTKNVKKQMYHDKKTEKKRVASDNWSFTNEDYLYTNQMKVIKNIKLNNFHPMDEISKISIQQINKKIYSYKRQDIVKKHFNNEKFIHFESIIDKMIECQLKCYYCKCEMNVLYDISREMKQWTVDRINNDLGHNLDNYYLACLECNLKRRRRGDDKFLFTKQLNLIKVNENDFDNEEK